MPNKAASPTAVVFIVFMRQLLESFFFSFFLFVILFFPAQPAVVTNVFPSPPRCVPSLGFSVHAFQLLII